MVTIHLGFHTHQSSDDSHIMISVDTTHSSHTGAQGGIIRLTTHCCWSCLPCFIIGHFNYNNLREISMTNLIIQWLTSSFPSSFSSSRLQTEMCLSLVLGWLGIIANVASVWWHNGHPICHRVGGIMSMDPVQCKLTQSHMATIASSDR